MGSMCLDLLKSFAGCIIPDRVNAIPEFVNE